MQSKPLSRLPLQDSTSFIDVEVRVATMLDAHNWHAVVQPHISATQRLDAAWDWPALYRRCQVAEAAVGRQVGLYCIDIPNDEPRAVPLAMMLISQGYPSLDGSYNGSVFIWYLTTAPSSALQSLKVSYEKPALVLAALVDKAIQVSYELGYDGRVGLHAAGAGGHKLYCAYRDSVRMTALEERAILSPLRRLSSGNDGRYFWLDPKLAQSLSNSLNYLR